MRKYQATCDRCPDWTAPARRTAEDSACDLRQHRCPDVMVPADMDPADLLALARRCARVYARTRGAYPDDDTIADAALGGWKALSTWKPDGGSALQPYLWMRMTGSIVDGLRSRSHLKRGDMEAVKAGRDDGGTGWEDLPASRQVPGSLDALREFGFDAADSTDPYRHVEVSDQVRQLLSVLKDRERDVIVRNMLSEESLASIGRDYGVTESRVCQIKASALNRMFDVAVAAVAA